MRSEQLCPPDLNDFEALRETFLELAGEPDAVVKQLPARRAYLKLERIYLDADCPWPPLTICLSGILRTMPQGAKLTIRYWEWINQKQTDNSSVNHDYVLAINDGAVETFGHSIRAYPELPSPVQERSSEQTHIYDAMLDQADEGARILRRNTGNQLELTSGDCYVLLERMYDLLGVGQGQGM